MTKHKTYELVISANDNETLHITRYTKDVTEPTEPTTSVRFEGAVSEETKRQILAMLPQINKAVHEDWIKTQAALEKE